MKTPALLERQRRLPRLQQRQRHRETGGGIRSGDDPAKLPHASLLQLLLSDHYTVKPTLHPLASKLLLLWVKTQLHAQLPTPALRSVMALLRLSESLVGPLLPELSASVGMLTKGGAGVTGLSLICGPPLGVTEPRVGASLGTSPPIGSAATNPASVPAYVYAAAAASGGDDYCSLEDISWGRRPRAPLSNGAAPARPAASPPPPPRKTSTTGAVHTSSSSASSTSVAPSGAAFKPWFTALFQLYGRALATVVDTPSAVRYPLVLAGYSSWLDPPAEAFFNEGGVEGAGGVEGGRRGGAVVSQANDVDNSMASAEINEQYFGGGGAGGGAAASRGVGQEAVDAVMAAFSSPSTVVGGVVEGQVMGAAPRPVPGAISPLAHSAPATTSLTVPASFEDSHVADVAAPAEYAALAAGAGGGGDYSTAHSQPEPIAIIPATDRDGKQLKPPPIIPPSPSNAATSVPPRAHSTTTTSTVRSSEQSSSPWSPRMRTRQPVCFASVYEVQRAAGELWHMHVMTKRKGAG